ncbi:hypothetical protein DQ04_03881070 [Trypanosoma grayi]|uniref:hypothetical protein n=1 Tax=Trypanosoma grayi TaxID=71804 RepID=UPI0004F41656|nr:hypothetical protein DQ04_03881070 [Trypanosoma grayi]KEG10322.1 hypothetical protein DQ04_03881070 [Trypanosoma grayi]
MEVVHFVAIDYAGASLGVAILIHDVNSNEMYCSLRVYDIGRSGLFLLPPHLPRGKLVADALPCCIPGCNTDLKMMVDERLLLFCLPGTASGLVLLLDTSKVIPSTDAPLPEVVLKGLSFCTRSGVYDAIRQRALLSLLGAREILTVAIPVDSDKRNDNTAVVSLFRLSVLRGSLHFHVCACVLLVCPTKKTKIGCVRLFFFVGEAPVLKCGMRVRVCLYYSSVLGDGHHLVLLAMEDDGSVQSFQIHPTILVTKGEPMKVYDEDAQQGTAPRLSLTGKERLAPRELYGSFPYALLVTASGHPCVRFSFFLLLFNERQVCG